MKMYICFPNELNIGSKLNIYTPTDSSLGYIKQFSLYGVQIDGENNRRAGKNCALCTVRTQDNFGACRTAGSS